MRHVIFQCLDSPKSKRGNTTKNKMRSFPYENDKKVQKTSRKAWEERGREKVLDFIKKWSIFLRNP